VMMRASNFFEKNPALWVPASVAGQDKSSKNAYDGDSAGQVVKAPVQQQRQGNCCSSRSRL